MNLPFRNLPIAQRLLITNAVLIPAALTLLLGESFHQARAAALIWMGFFLLGLNALVWANWNRERHNR